MEGVEGARESVVQCEWDRRVDGICLANLPPFQSGKYRDALAVYSEVLTVDPKALNLNSKVYYNRALVNSKLGNLKDAISDCSAALHANQGYL